MVRFVFAAAVLAFASEQALAQHAQPYAGQESREVKGLSAKQVADLKAGRGMGLALPAELNGYPGPSHTLELANELGLSSEQRVKVQALFDSMKAEAVSFGGRLISQERELDRQFKSKTVTPQSLAASTAAIGATQAELRNAHLKYHLATADVLTPDQLKRYAELRGYSGRMGGEHSHLP